jgi:DNA polymerase IV (DinB-like DNA polymerase)
MGAPNRFDVDRDDPRVIVHVDMDCFYASCERLRRPELEGEPVVVGMGYDREDPHGAVATASYEAREYGVESAMAIGEAMEHLPRMADADPDDAGTPDPDDAGYYVPVDMAYYQEVGAAVRSILADRADTLEPTSIDEAYLDVSESVEWDEAETFAADLQRRIDEAVGVDASVGVAPTKSAAKVASDYDKPEGLVIVEPGDVRSFFEPLAIDAVHGIGPVTAEELETMGIETAGDLAAADPAEVESRFGSRGRELHDRARGVDPRPVEPPDDPKSLSNEKSLGDPTTDTEAKRERVKALAERVAERASEKGALYRTIGIKVVTPPFDIQTRERSLSGPVEDPELVEREALSLLQEFEDAPVRKLGVRVSNLEFADRDQGTLGDWSEDPEVTQTTDDRSDEPDDSATERHVPDRTRNVPNDPEQLTLAAYADS